jgi:hypothetical protein
MQCYIVIIGGIQIYLFIIIIIIIIIVVVVVVVVLKYAMRTFFY